RGIPTDFGRIEFGLNLRLYPRPYCWRSDILRRSQGTEGCRMIVTIHQPNYLPYLGFFHKMANADLFVVYDTALYSKQLGLHNRNRIKTPQGAQWLTVPVQHATLHALRDVQIVQGPCGTRHRLSLDANYKKADRKSTRLNSSHRLLS